MSEHPKGYRLAPSNNARDLRARVDSHSRNGGNYLIYGAPQAWLDRRAADEIDQLTALVNRMLDDRAPTPSPENRAENRT